MNFWHSLKRTLKSFSDFPPPHFYLSKTGISNFQWYIIHFLDVLSFYIITMM